MPSGKVHDSVNLLATACVDIIAYRAGVDPVHILIFSIGSLLATFYLSPDLDLEGTRPVKRWGRLGFIWKPYAYFVPHRGISHVPIIGIAGRLFYLFVIFLIFWIGVSTVLVATGLSPPDFGFGVVFKPEFWLPFTAGMLFADTLHIALDRLESGLKRRIRSRARGGTRRT